MYKATITNIQTAFKKIKHFCPDEREGDYRLYAREALKRIIEDRMGMYRDAYLNELRGQDVVGRCNSYYPRLLRGGLGRSG